jgi:hypothetical protein
LDRAFANRAASCQVPPKKLSSFVAARHRVVLGRFHGANSRSDLLARLNAPLRSCRLRAASWIPRYFREREGLLRRVDGRSGAYSRGIVLVEAATGLQFPPTNCWGGKCKCQPDCNAGNARFLLAASFAPDTRRCRLVVSLITDLYCPFSYFALPCATPVLGFTKLVSLGTENHIEAKGLGDSCRMALRSWRSAPYYLTGIPLHLHA